MRGTAPASGLRRDDRIAPRSAALLRGGSGVEPVAGDPFVVRAHVGRVVELKMLSLVGLDDVSALSESLLEIIESIGGSALLLADYRAATPFAHDVADAWSRSMRRFNAAVERSAIWLDPANDTFNLQIARVVRCAGSPRRRCMQHAADVRDWLCAVATASEAACIDDLLRE